MSEPLVRAYTLPFSGAFRVEINIGGGIVHSLTFEEAEALARKITELLAEQPTTLVDSPVPYRVEEHPHPGGELKSLQEEPA